MIRFEHEIGRTGSARRGFQPGRAVRRDEDDGDRSAQGGAEGAAELDAIRIR